jgi:RecA-family ATPase
MKNLSMATSVSHKHLDGADSKKPILRCTNFSDMEPKDYDWLWPGMICKGKVHTIAGDGGIGKTTILLTIGATITRGGIFEGEREPCKSQRVLYLSGEDDGDDTLMPRARASGADLTKLEQVPSQHGNEIISIMEHAGILEETIKSYGDVGLFIIDPVTSFCGRNFQNNSPTDVRLVMSKLHQIASRTNVAIMVLTHLRKDTTGSMLSRLLGSGAWTHGARVVMGVMKSPKHGFNILGKLNTNITDEDGCFAYTIETKNIEGLIQEVPYADWINQTFYKTLSDMEEAEGDVSSYGEKTSLACTILSELLADGKPHPHQDVRDACEKEGIRGSTMKEAGKTLGVIYTRTKTMPSTTTWALPNPLA